MEPNQELTTQYWKDVTEKAQHCVCGKKFIKQPIDKNGQPFHKEEANYYYAQWCRYQAGTFGCWHCKHYNHFTPGHRRVCANCKMACPVKKAPKPRQILAIHKRHRTYETCMMWSCPDCGFPKQK